MSKEPIVEKKYREGVVELQLNGNWSREELLKALKNIDERSTKLIINSSVELEREKINILRQAIWQLANINKLNKDGKIEIKNKDKAISYD